MPYQKAGMMDKEDEFSQKSHEATKNTIKTAYDLIRMIDALT
jgi:hypothetical protein